MTTPDYADKIRYYNGFNDGVHSCFSALSALIEGVNSVNDPNQLKMMIVNTANTIAEIENTTSSNLEMLIKKIKED